MRLSLTRKLFVCFLSLTAAVLLATLVLARWSFERGFLDYVNNLERLRLERIGELLVERYAAAGEDWSALATGSFEDIVARRPPRPPRRHLGEAEGTPPDATPGGAPTPTTSRSRRPRTALFGADGRQLAGDVITAEPANRVDVPLIHDGRVIGELRSFVQRRLDSPGETAFSRQQARRSVLIGTLALVLAAIVSWWLSRSLLAPVRRSITSVARLSRGDYTTDETSLAAPSGDDELGRLADDLERLRHSLEAGRTARRRLLADVSHELRTPLTILSGEIDAMRDGLRPFGPEQLASLAQEVDRLTRLVEDLFALSLSDVGGLRYTFAPLDVGTLLEQSVAAFEHIAADRGLDIALELAGSLRASGDASRLEQLFTNLLSNAIDYTDSPGAIHVLARASADAVDIVVEDTPPAPATARLEELFESLYRDEHSRNRRSGGAGLGLAICRNIVTAHRGRIAASRSAFGGLRVELTLPVRRESTA